MRLEGKVMLVTGAASGIGAEVARRSAREGARVLMCDINEEGGKALASEIREAGGEATFFTLDVTQEQAWIEAVETAEARYGRLDVLVNNAGITERKLIEETSLDSWDRVMAVNATGVFLGIKHAIPAMRRAGGGSIINISSAYGLVGGFAHPAYFASKGAVRLLTKAIAVQHAGDNIRVNSVHPGFVETPMTAEFHASGAREERIAQTPLGWLAEPSDIVGGIVFLASDDAAYMTGSELVIDGGVTAH